jgi:hypothetical protein
MRRAGYAMASEHSPELAVRLEALHNAADVCRVLSVSCDWSDRETLATLGAAGVDDSPTTTGLHANEKAMGTGPADLGRLVSAFHDNKSCSVAALGRVRPSARFSGNPRLSPFFLTPASACVAFSA